MRRLRLLLKKGEVQLQPLDVNEVERNALNLMRSDLVNQNVALYTEFAPHLPAVNGDDVQLQQVLLNLVVNGCDAMASVEAVGRRLLVRTELADGEKVRVSVVDQGCGIPPEKIERILRALFHDEEAWNGAWPWCLPLHHLRPRRQAVGVSLQIIWRTFLHFVWRDASGEYVPLTPAVATRA